MQNDQRVKIFSEAYTQAFIDSYPEFTVANTADLIQRAICAAAVNIFGVGIDGKAFKLTAKRLGIKCTYKAFDEYLNGGE